MNFILEHFYFENNFSINIEYNLCEIWKNAIQMCVSLRSDLIMFYCVIDIIVFENKRSSLCGHIMRVIKIYFNCIEF